MSTQNIPFLNTKKKIFLNYPKSASMVFFQGTQNGFETAVVNEPSVFEPLKFNCNSSIIYFYILKSERPKKSK